MTLSLTRVTEADKKTLFDWRNLDEIIRLSASQKPVSWLDHCDWFQRSLASESKLLLLICSDLKPIGHVRFDYDGLSSSDITIYLLPAEVGRGRGSFIIKSACMMAAHEFLGLSCIKAVIREDNLRSINAFRKAGFHNLSSQSSNDITNLVTLVYELT